MGESSWLTLSQSVKNHIFEKFGFKLVSNWHSIIWIYNPDVSRERSSASGFYLGYNFSKSYGITTTLLSSILK